MHIAERVIQLPEISFPLKLDFNFLDSSFLHNHGELLQNMSPPGSEESKKSECVVPRGDLSRWEPLQVQEKQSRRKTGMYGCLMQQ